MSEGLSQDDFRKLLATPRRSNNDNNTPFTAPAPKTPKSTGAIFAQPRSMRKKNFKKSFNKDQQGQEDEEEEEKTSYRDRAAERRKQDDSTTSEDQLTTEELLQRTKIEEGQELDARQLYEQSKYLGGDIDHTHLVKGLDFALLKKVRTDLTKKQQINTIEQQQQQAQVEEDQEDQSMDIDNDLDQVLEKFERGERVADDTTIGSSVEDIPKFHTLMAKNIYQYIQDQVNPDQQPRTELFESGRMAFVFELADEVGHYSDAFAIPTAMIRSKADVAAKLSKSGFSEDSQAESSLVVDKISQVMNRIRNGASVENVQESKTATKITKEPVAMANDGFMGDIFADAGRDYELDESTVTEATDEAKGNYFKDLVDEGDENEDEQMTEAVNALLSQATGDASADQGETKNNPETTNNKRKYNHMEMDADAADIDMFGLSSSALPTSFEEHTTAYQSDNDDGSDDSDVNQKEKSAMQMMDQGTNRNKKAQLTRWDFDTENEWQNYKDNIEIHPKSAFQYGVKLTDGRKRNKERKGMNDKQRLDRDYQQVKNIMTKKYGKSLDS